MSAPGNQARRGARVASRTSLGKPEWAGVGRGAGQKKACPDEISRPFVSPLFLKSNNLFYSFRRLIFDKKFNDRY